MSAQQFSQESADLIRERGIEVGVDVAWSLLMAAPAVSDVVEEVLPDLVERAGALTSFLRDGGLEYPPGTPEWMRADLQRISIAASCADDSLAITSRESMLRPVVVLACDEDAVVVLPGVEQGMVMLVTPSEAALVASDVLSRLQEAGVEWAARRRRYGRPVVAVTSRDSVFEIRAAEGAEPPQTIALAMGMLIGGADHAGSR